MAGLRKPPEPVELPRAVVPDRWDRDGFWEGFCEEYEHDSLVPGVSAVRKRVRNKGLEHHHFDTLLYRGENLELLALLQFFAVDMPPLEAAGNFNVMVRPSHRRRGLATLLVNEALARGWGLTPTSTLYTASGRAFADNFWNGVVTPPAPPVSRRSRPYGKITGPEATEADE